MTKRESDSVTISHGKAKLSVHDTASSFRGVIELYNSYSFHSIDRTPSYDTVADAVYKVSDSHGSCRTATFHAMVGL